MLLKSISMAILVSFSASASAEKTEIPGLLKRTYKLKAFTMSLGSKKDRNEYCGSSAKPVRRIEKGENGEYFVFFRLNDVINFQWNETDTSRTARKRPNGCSDPVIKKIERSGEQSTLTMILYEECNSVVQPGRSSREVYRFNGDEIVYENQPVVFEAGEWRADKSLEGYTCVWVAKN